MSWYLPRLVSPELASHPVCGWTATVAGTHALVPDGCVDVLWTSRGDVWVCGPETQGWTITLPAGTRAVGMRFRPGVVADVLRVNVTQLRDRRVAAPDLLGTRHAARLADRLTDSESDEPGWACWSPRLPAGCTGPTWMGCPGASPARWPGGPGMYPPWPRPRR